MKKGDRVIVKDSWGETRIGVVSSIFMLHGRNAVEVYCYYRNLVKGCYFPHNCKVIPKNLIPLYEAVYGTCPEGIL